MLTRGNERMGVACAALVLAIGGANAQTPSTWMKARVVEPTSWSGHALAYDAPRGQVVLFGGLQADTWEWNASSWRLRAPAASPPGRRSHALAHDLARQRVVLFGGADGSGMLSDTWEWDGGTWTQRSPLAAPAARGWHAMAYDVARQRVVLFGGSPLVADTWEWDGASWSVRTPAASPAARSGHVMAYDLVRQRVVLFGGWDGSGELDDTWEWDGATWSPASPAVRPPQRSGHALAYDLGRQRTVLFGGAYGVPGIGSVSLHDTWEWDGTTWTPRASSGPPWLENPTMAFDLARQRAVLFGTIFDYYRETRETWEWDGSAWSQRDSMTAPRDLSGSMAYDSARERVVLFSDWTSETWEWDGHRWALRALGPSVYSSRMAYDTARQRIVLCGWIAATCEWDGTTWTTHLAPGPGQRLFTAVAYDMARQKTVQYGGWSGSGGVLAGTWLWDGTTWTQANPATSPPLLWQGHAMAYDVVRQRVVLFGGYDGTSWLTETWEWDGTNWVQLTPTVHPPAGGVMVYDAARQRVVLLGAGIWEWDGVVWTQVQTTSAGGKAAYDMARQRLVAFGSAGTWLYGPLAPAGSQLLGSGCPGSNGVPHMTAEVPWLGNQSFSVDLLAANASAPCVLGLAASPGNVAIGGGCTLWLDPQQLITSLLAAANTSGSASAQFAVPADPALRGQPFFAQWFVLDPQGPVLGLAFSAGRAFVLGD